MLFYVGFLGGQISFLSVTLFSIKVMYSTGKGI